MFDDRRQILFPPVGHSRDSPKRIKTPVVMDDLITKESTEFRELTGQIRTAHKNIVAVREKHRPTIADERCLSGEEVMEYLHISPRTLQNLRDNRIIGFTTIGGKILYPERELQKVLLDNYRPTEPPF